jgi:hypothetical protein
MYASTVIPLFLPPPSFIPAQSHKLTATRGLSLAHAVTAVTYITLFHRMLMFVILPLDSVME